MRKALTAAVVLALVLCGCTGNNGIKRDVGAPKPNVGGRFLCDKSYTFETVVDSKTGVTYLVWKDGIGGDSKGGITVLVDRDGKPIISEEVDE
jgi:hypothetical protein